MKIRIRGNSIRLRLSQSEIAELAKTGRVENRTEFGREQTLVYALNMSDSVDSLDASFQNGRIELIVPKVVAENWMNTENVGISDETDFTRILIEKDFACLTERENEDESDNFPHPKTNQKC